MGGCAARHLLLRVAVFGRLPNTAGRRLGGRRVWPGRPPELGGHLRLGGHLKLGGHLSAGLPGRIARVIDLNGAHEVADVEFDAEGATLRGWLYRPQSADSALPVVVMAHGYNCIKELYLDKYAAAIASAGHVVL